MQQCKVDPCVFRRKNIEIIMILCVYVVGDIIVEGESDVYDALYVFLLCKSFKQHKKTFQVI